MTKNNDKELSNFIEQQAKLVCVLIKYGSLCNDKKHNQVLCSPCEARKLLAKYNGQPIAPIKKERRSLNRRDYQFFLAVRVPDCKKPQKEDLQVIRSWEVGHLNGEGVTKK